MGIPDTSLVGAFKRLYGSIAFVRVYVPLGDFPLRCQRVVVSALWWLPGACLFGGQVQYLSPISPDPKGSY
jgi:hypothetical protein